MVDERILQLIHAELDGEIDDGDRTELLRHLEAEPEARALREQLGRIAGALGRMAPVAQPAELHLQLLQVTRRSARVITFRERRAQIVRYGLAMAAGMAFAAIGLSLTESGRPTFDPGELAGTMGRQAAHPVGAVAARRVAAPKLNGLVTLSPAAGRWLLLFDLDSGQPVTVSATYDAAAFRLNGYAQADSGVSSFSATPGRVGFVNQGAQRLALFLEPGAGGPVQIRFEGAGKVLEEAVLEVPGKGRLR